MAVEPRKQAVKAYTILKRSLQHDFYFSYAKTPALFLERALFKPKSTSL